MGETAAINDNMNAKFRLKCPELLENIMNKALKVTDRNECKGWAKKKKKKM